MNTTKKVNRKTAVLILCSAVWLAAAKGWAGQGACGDTGFKAAQSPGCRVSCGYKTDGVAEPMDADNDGRISADEYSAFFKARFARLDKNADGYIDADEMAVRRERGAFCPAVANFDEWDANGDGRVTPQEFKGSDKVFALWDKNGDGSLSEMEVINGTRPGCRKPCDRASAVQ